LAWCCEEAPDFFSAVRYGLIEESAFARDVQAGNFAAAGMGEKAEWIRDLAARDEKAAGVFFSNELVDAFPVRRVVRRDGEWREGYVELDARGEFRWGEREIADSALAEAVRDLPAVEGYATEINLRARRWMVELARAWGRGYVVTIDYGFPAPVYYARFRSEGTLTAYREHRRSKEVLAEPGGQDITAHVDFTALARAGEAEGLETLGFVDQQRFLTGVAHDELAGSAGPRVGVAENLRAWQTLTHPEYLGSRFQVLVQGKGVPGGLAGLRYARVGGLD
jgi:SAM-dependent MidA family methyltransferase